MVSVGEWDGQEYQALGWVDLVLLPGGRRERKIESSWEGRGF